MKVIKFSLIVFAFVLTSRAIAQEPEQPELAPPAPVSCSAWLDCGDGSIYCSGKDECSASGSKKTVTCDGKTIKC